MNPENKAPENNPRKIACCECPAVGTLPRCVYLGPSKGEYFKLPEGWGVNKFDCETTLFVCPDCLP